MMLRLSKWLFYALSLTPLLVWKGLFYQYSTVEALFVMAVVEAMVVCFVWAVHKDPRVWSGPGPVGKVFMGLITILILASVMGVNPILSFWSEFGRLTGVIFWMHLLGLLVVGNGILRTKEDWHGFFFCSTLVGLAVSFLHLFSFTGLDGVWLINRSATIANSTFFGVYLLFQLVFCLLLFATASKWYKAYATGAFVIFVFALWTSEAQAVILSCLGGLVLLVALLAIQARSHRFWRGLGVVTVVVLVVGFFVGVVNLSDPGSSTRQWFVQRASGARFVLWNIAWEGIKDRPVLGWGPENFATVFQTYYDPCFGSSLCGAQRVYDRAHSKVLDVFVETGILGIGAYLALFAVTILRLWQRVWEPHEMAVPAIITSGLVAYFVQNLVALDVPITLLCWGLLLVFADHFCRHDAHKKNKPHSISIGSAVGVSVCALIVFVVAVLQPLRANLSIATWFEAQDPTQRLMAFDRATSLSWVGMDERRTFLARQSTGTIWIAGIRGETPAVSAQEELDILQARLGESLERQPQSIPLMLNLALVLHTRSKFFGTQGYEQAIQLLQEGIAHHPVDPQLRWALASLYLEQNRVQEALTMTQTALALNPAVAESHIQRLIAVKFSKDEERFLEYAREALVISPGLEPEIRLIYESDLGEKKDQLLFELY